jgi:hypothetical protein
VLELHWATQIQILQLAKRVTLKQDAFVRLTRVFFYNKYTHLSYVERDSPRDQFVVTLFLLTVFGLLLGAGIKNRILKAGFTPELPWRRNNARWWEVSWFHLSRFAGRI